MKKLIITYIAFLFCLSAAAQDDTISVIGIIDNIKPIHTKDTNQGFEIRVKTLGVISGKIDSVIDFHIHSPAKQLLITDYQKVDTYKENVYYFILTSNINGIVFIDALLPNILEGKCPKCDKPLQGFRFIGDAFAHYVYYCPVHGEMGEEWEHYE
jgi:hypothetical protein